MEGELQQLPIRSTRARIRMGKGKGVPLCLGFLFSCCLISTALIVGGALLLRFAEEPLIDSQVDQRMQITNGSALYQQLQDPGLPLWKSFYFYNLTNPEKWALGQELPKLKELGPYSFREKRNKYIQSIEGDILTYNQTKYFYWDPTKSAPNASDDDLMCTINIPMVAAIAQVEDSNLIMREALKGVFVVSKAHMYVCHKARDLAWNYTDSLVKDLHTLKQYPRTYVNIQVNGSTNDSAHSAIYTGVGDINRLGELITWDGHHQYLKTWPRGESNPANKIRGNEGLFFRPLLTEDDNVTAFIDDVQRSFDLVFTERVKHLHTEALRYRVVNSTFESAFKNHDNANFGSWCPDGLIYLGPTQYPEIPVYGSKPHYLDGDPTLRDCCGGTMTPPNRTIHDITLDIEPTTGANIQVKQILQINVQVNKSKHFSQTENLIGYNYNQNTTLYYPVLWVSEHAELTPEFEQYLDDQGLAEVEAVRKAVPIIFWVLIGVAAVCLVISVISCVGYVIRARQRQKGREDETRPLLSPRSYN